MISLIPNEWRCRCKYGYLDYPISSASVDDYKYANLIICLLREVKQLTHEFFDKRKLQNKTTLSWFY